MAAMPSAWAADRVVLNDTGVIRCLEHRQRWSFDCAKSRQDAAYGRDVNNNDPVDGDAGFSFRKVCRSGQMAGEGSCPADPALGTGPDDWGCVYDNVSQLTWEVKTQDGGLHDYNKRFTNKGRKARDQPSDAAWLVDATNGEALCGGTSWRLPDPLELHSLVNDGRASPAIDPAYFPNTSNAHYWTRIEYVGNPAWGWSLDPLFGDILIEQQMSEWAARLVHRAGSHGSLAKDRFVPSSDGAEVTDTMTGLVWRRCLEGMVWDVDQQACTGVARDYGWKGALDHARENRQGGWRLPNIKELFSIVDHSTEAPALDRFAFPDTPASHLVMSSTPIGNGSGADAFVVSFSRGQTARQNTLTFSWKLRLVRGGRQ
jgi:hypothetical protein